MLAHQIDVSKELKLRYLSREKIDSGDIIDRTNLATWIDTNLDELTQLAKTLGPLLEESLPKAWGEPGVAGDARAIMQVAEEVGTTYRSILDWSIRVRSARGSGSIAAVIEELASVSSEIVPQIEGIGPRLSEEIDKALAPDGTKNVTLKLKLSMPDPSRLLLVYRTALQD
jgi:hypothetical protein